MDQQHRGGKQWNRRVSKKNKAYISCRSENYIHSPGQSIIKESVVSQWPLFTTALLTSSPLPRDPLSFQSCYSVASIANFNLFLFLFAAALGGKCITPVPKMPVMDNHPIGVFRPLGAQSSKTMLSPYSCSAPVATHCSERPQP